MVGRSGGGGGSSGFDYVQDPNPQAPEEGEEWYDTGSNAAFVYTGDEWVEQTIVDHGQLSGVGANDHHAPPSSTNSHEGGGSKVTSGVNVSGSGLIGMPISYIHTSNSSSYGRTLTVYYADGTKDEKETYGGMSCDPSKLAVSFTSQNGDLTMTGVEAAHTARHSHSI